MEIQPQGNTGKGGPSTCAYYSLRITAWLIFIVVTGALLVAWSLELFFNFVPCELCLIERIPYYVSLPVLAAVAYGATRRWRLPLLYFGLFMASCILLITLIVSAYHAGVEWQLWAGPSSCSDTGLSFSDTTSDLSGLLKTTRLARCDEPPFLLLGLSPAGWNTLLSAALIFIALREVSHGMLKKRD